MTVELDRPSTEPAARSSPASLPGSSSAIPRLPRSGCVERFASSLAQESLWSVERRQPGSAASNHPCALALAGELRLTALGRALRGVVQRHESLRTAFAPGRRGPLQVVAPPSSIRSHLPVVDLAGLAPARRAREADRLGREEARRPFDVTRGPLVRVALLRAGAREHTLLVTLHRIVADRRSLGVLLADLGELYRAAAAGRAPELEELPVQLADFAAWQRSRLAGPALEEQLAYWRERLAGAPQLLALPADRPRPPVRTSRCARCRADLDPELTRGLGELAAREGTTRSTVLLAALFALVHRLTGQRDLVIGSTVDGRSHEETERLVGCLRNTLALRARIDGPGLTFRELLRRVREADDGARAHADLPFETLVAELGIERSGSHAPVFQVLFGERRTRPERLELPGLEARIEEPETGVSHLDLALVLAEAGAGDARRLEGWVRYDRDLFDATTVRRMAQRLEVLARGVLSDPGRAVGDLPWLTAAERQQLVEWNDTAAAGPGDAALHELIAARARRVPERIAVICEAETLSYRELERRVLALAGRLRAEGVGPESRVAVCAERSAELIVALLAVLEAGGAYLPVDPTYPPDRVRFLLEDSRVPVLLVQRRLAGSLPAAGAREVVLEEGGPRAAAATEGSPPAPGVGGGERLAYVIYTSGSTGRPKGVMSSHRGIVNRLTWAQERDRLDGSDRVLQKTPISFDVSVWELFWPLLAGAGLVMAKPEGHKDPAYLVRAIGDHRVTTLHFVPSMLHAFVESPGLEGCRSLRRVFASGEALSRDLEQRFFERMPRGVRLENLYGPTEAAVEVTWWPCARRTDGAPVPIGRPVANTAIRLLDPGFHAVPPEVPGELAIGGVQVARGYLGRTALTAERFVPDPASPEPGARLYRTGDLARRRPDGAVEFLGRIDHQVKVRGFRIELGEIEAALQDLPAVAEAAVLALPSGPDGGLRLVAYAVARDGEPEETTLRAALAAVLPEPMVPSAFVWLEALPLSPNGKVDRGALSRIGPPAPGRRGSDEPPETPVEQAVAELWREVLGLEGGELPGRRESFLALAGDSIRAAVVANRLQELLGEIVHAVAILDHPTVADLAAYLESDYPEAVARLWGRAAERPDPPGERSEPVDEPRIAALRSVVDAYEVGAAAPPVRLPRAVFLLSPPRSGSTLLRAMLAGHPGLFSPPELELLTFDDMAQRRTAFSGRASFWREGLIRAVMETHGGDVVRAREILADFEERGAGTAEVYRELQERLGGRVLVDKTTSYALYRSVLGRAEELFDEPLYVHLVRHPCGMIRSFEEARLEQVFFRHEHPVSRRELAELIWVASHRNIAERFGLLPRERCHRLRFEDLVRDPEGVLGELCRFLGLGFDPAVADPYDDPAARMTDGLHAESRMVGDVKFHRYKRVDPAVAERWRESRSEDDLGEPTRALAAALGYGIERRRAGPGRAGAPVAAPRLRRRFSTAPGTELPLSAAQERLWFLDRLEPGGSAYNMPGALDLRGRLDAEALRRAFGEVVRRHAVLRSRFADHGGTPVQVVEPPRPWRLPLVDLRRLPARRRDLESKGLARREAQRPFDLGTPPFLRTALLRLEAERHVALTTMHHIAADGWSTGVLARELAALYPALAAGEPPAAAPLPLQYADYAAWHREWISGERLDGQLDRWRRRLEGAPQVLELPSDRPRPVRSGSRGGTRRRTLSAGLSAGLRELARDRGATLFMALFAGLAALLGRLTGRDDLLVGTPTAGRNRVELEGLIGMFVNTLALRADLSGDPGFAELLARARGAALAAFADQDLPFERLVEELRPDRDGSHSPLVQVMVVLQNVPGGWELPGVVLEPVELDTGTARFDLTFIATQEPKGLVLAVDFDRDRFDAATADRFLGHLQTLLASATGDPALPVSRLPLLGAGERAQILVEWNDTAADAGGLPGGELLLHRAVARWAERTPDAVAVAFGRGRDEVRWSYGELHRRAGRLARLLAGLGVGPDVLVGLSVERSPELVLGVLGVLGAGGAWLPLDPTYPRERLQLMVEDAAPRVILTQERLLRALPEHRAELVVLDRLDRGSGACSAQGEEDRELEPDRRLRPENLAYVIYTSGSTGRPKGVALSHRGLVNLCRAQAATFGPGPQDRVLQFAPASFDGSVFELAMALRFGAEIHLADRDTLLPGEPLVRLLRERRITNATLPPSALAALPPPAPAGLPALATVLVAGEACPPELARAWSGAPGRRFFNAYGPTETTVWVSAEPYDNPAREVTIGRPAANVRVHLQDRRGTEVPAGVPGELLAGGPGLARGYLGRPAASAERFVPDPCAHRRGEPGARLYRTGDLARYLPDGRIDFLGRLDHQVKVRGFRIELGEVEAVLSRHPAIAEAVVVARDGGPGGRRLVAYAVPRGEEPPPGGALEAELRRALSEVLPEYMVPAAVVLLPEMSRSPAGKVDRRALPAPPSPGSAAAATGPGGAPEGPLEELLAGVWEELLELEPGTVSRSASFFDLGGHSLLATRVVARVREALAVELPVRRLFERPTLRALAAEIADLLAGRRGGAGAPPAPPLLAVPRDGAPPLSFAQERLWFLDRLQPGEVTYNIPAALRLTGRLDVAAFRAALDAVVARHESLRTTFAARGGRPVQVIAPRLRIAAPVADLTGLARERRAAEARRLAGIEARTPFDLAAGPLLRAALLRLGEAEHVLLLDLHHAVADGWSMAVLMRELGALHGAADLPAPPVQYADFAVWQRAWLSGAALAAQVAYWRDALAGLPELLELPTDRPRPAVRSLAGGAVNVALGGELTAAVGRVARERGATPFMVLLAAFQALLSRYSGQRDLAVGIPVANRTHAATEGLIGFFVNTLVLRGDLSGGPDFAALLDRARERALAAYAHQDLPFEKLVAELRPVRSLAHSPLFQVMLVLQNAPFGALALPGLSLEPLPEESPAAKFDLTLNLGEPTAEPEAGLAGSFQFRRDLFDATTVERMTRHLRTLLRAAVAAPAIRLADLPLLAPAELRQLREWNDTARPLAGEGGELRLHRLIRRAASAAPERVAVVAGAGHLSYGALERRARGLARRLRSLGAGPEVRVGVCAERSLDLAIGLLGVLEAGAAYVPLDPAYPPERLAYMLEDASARVLVAQRAALEALPALAGAVPRVVLLEDLADGAEAAGESRDGGARPGTGPGVGPGGEPDAGPDALAYVIYTSGSTGRPKGSMNAHRGIANRLLWMLEALGLDGGARVLQKTPFSFDVSVWELFAPLVGGGQLVMAPPGAHRDPELLARLLAAERITVSHFVPSMLQAFVEASGIEACSGSLSQVVASGEALPPDLVARFGARLESELYNLYGPTEAAVEVTWWKCPRGPAGSTVPIGRPVANTAVHLVDPAFRPVPVGVPGELLLAGVQVGRGYLDRPALTAERFVPDPFAAAAGGGGARLYRSGDLARLRPDGAVEFLGRLDHQVKVRGVRIELGEVEAVLRDHPGVREAVVVAAGGAGGRRLAAYAVPVEGREPGAAELQEHLARALPEAMVPAAFTLLPALPLTPSGKVDRRALPAPRWGTAAGERRRVPPRTPVEELVAGVWSQVLEVEEVGADDDFFALGGHSLLGVRLIARLLEATGAELPLMRLFEAPTVAGLAGALEAALAGEREAPPPPLRPVPRDGRALRLSPAQERLWFLDRLAPESPWYNVPAALRLAGPLDAPRLARCLAAVVRRHETLRTVFESSGEAPVQVILPPPRAELPLVELAAGGGGRPGRLGPPGPLDQARALAAREARRPFDLARGPLLRATLLRLEPELHVLLLTLHHAVSDAWSIGVLLRELATLYRHRGEEGCLPALPVQYADYAAWQRERLAEGRFERELEYWRGRLAGAPPVLELPCDRPRPATRSVAGGRVGLRLPAPAAAGLRRLGRDHGATLFMTLLAAGTAWLARHGAGTDLVLGSPVSGRDRTEVEGLVGFFVNLLPLRLDLGGDPSVAELLARARAAVLEAHAHRGIPFERLVEELRPARDPSHDPLVQGVLALEEEAPALELPGIAVEALELESATAKFDLTLSLRDDGAGLTGVLEFRRDLFDPPTAARLAARFERLAAALAPADGAAAEAGALRLSELPLLAPAERHQVVVEWNATATRFPREATVHGLLRAVAAARPDAAAVEIGGETLSYGGLARAADRLALRLRELGVGPEAPVGLAMERSADLVVGMLGVLEAGGFYVPLDPSYPAERLAFMVEDTGLAVVLTRRGRRLELPVGGAEVVAIDRPAARPAREPAAVLDAGASSDRLAYAMYTSGSTGRPKGVAIPHRAIVRLVLETDYVRLGPGDRVVQAANASFDAATFEIWGPLLTGGTVVGAEREVTLSPGDLAAWLRDTRATSLFLTTALFDQVAVERPDAFSTLREVLFGGEAVDPERVRAVLEAGPPRRLLHVYGPTESTTFATWHPTREVAPGAATVPIGRPIANTRLHLVGPDLRPVPAGVPGEPVLGGDGLARGYLGRPALTAERFAPDPFAGEAGARVYRTGDLARLRPDGAVEFLGRIDQQVKIRGFRVEPGEIEAALRAQSRVAEAAVLVHDDLPGGRTLVAYLVPTAGEAVPDGLREELRGRLPDFMVPAFFVAVPELPLTANRKLDRRALREIGAARIASTGAGAGAVAPRTPTETLLAGIWGEVLRVEGLGVEDDFFELGGHSLLAVRLASRVRAAFGRELPLRDLFERPTVAAVAALLDGGEAARDEAPPLTPRPRQAAGTSGLPLSFAQQRLWFLDRLEPGSALYNVPVAFRCSGALRPDLLARALSLVVRRHEALRTTFPAPSDPAGEPVQVVHPPRPVPLPVVDLSALPAARRRADAEALARAEARRSFDLARGPLLRSLVVRLEARRHLLAIVQHHIVSDGWSVGVLVGELAAAYGAWSREGSREGSRGRSRRGAPALPELPVQYADFAAWERRWLAGGALARRVAFWRERLAGLPPLELPVDRPRPALQTFRGAGRRALLGADLAAAVTALARRRSATPFMVLLAAFQALLGRISGQEDFAVGSPVAGRGRREVEGAIGFFVNTLALRADLAGDPGFAALLARTRSVALECFAHQEVPFEKLVEELSPERDLARPPLFQAAFALQERAPVPALPGLELEPFALDPGVARWELGMAVVAAEAGLEVAMAFNRDLFDATRIERMLGHFRRLLEGAAADPERPLSSLALLGPAERHQLLAEWNDPARGLHLAWDRHPGASPPELFAARAQRTPDAVALAVRGGALSYRALAQRAAALARGLRRAGVGPEVVVGVSMERSFDLVAALLAVLRAGGAYLPLDPAYPDERLAFMMADSGLAVLLADRDSATALPAPGEAVRLLVPAELARKAELERAGSGRAPGEERFADPGPEGAAYVIYTSGSTGAPKGVVGTRGAMGNLLAERRRGTVGPDDRVLFKTPVSFDASLFEIFSPLAAGGTVVLARPGGEQDAGYQVRLVAEERVTVAGSTPSLLATLLEQPGIDGCRTLRRMGTGSEAVPLELARRYHELGLSDLFNLYGPTETTVAVLEWRSRPGADERTLPIGRPLAGARVVLLDPGGEPVAVGVPGELYVGGPSLARGYLGRPAATAQRYLPDPFSGRPGSRVYRTGDLARFRSDGAVEFLGRLDRQVKVRGFRVELGEVERALLDLPGIREAAVVAQEAGAEATRRLVAFLVAEEGGEPDAGELRELLTERLPSFMVPAAFVLLSELPLNPSGKVDRTALAALEPGPERAAAARSGGYAAPRDPIERELCGIWRDLLEVERVGIRDDFFELGGHSLLAVRLAARVAAATGRELPLAGLFQAPTVERLAVLLRGGEPTAAGAALVPLQPHGTLPPLFLVHAIGGTVFAYRELALALGGVDRSGAAPGRPDRPVWGLQARGLAPGGAPRVSIEEMARDYLEEVTGVQPEGPYRLAGWSFGALVAFEMARRLAARGEEVELLALIDPATPGAAEAAAGALSETESLLLLARDLGAQAGAEVNLPAAELEAAARSGGADAALGRALEAVAEAGALPPDFAAGDLRRIAAVYRANAAAAARYRPQPWDGGALAVFAAQSPSIEGLPRWRSLLSGGVAVRRVAGDHYGLLRPGAVAALARVLEARLAAPARNPRRALGAGAGEP